MQIEVLVIQWIAVASIFLAGCSTSRIGRADFSAAEARIDMAIESAGPETRKHLVAAREQLKSAVQACNASAEQLDEAIKDKNDALSKAAYWKEKQRKALKELWFWRGALIISILVSLRGPLLWLARKFIGIPW